MEAIEPSLGLLCFKPREEEREWRHGGGRPCLPPVVAGRACDERRELGSFRLATTAVATAERRG